MKQLLQHKVSTDGFELGSIHFENRTGHNIDKGVVENNIGETKKKEWSKPFFEIISKDIIKGGPGVGGEGAYSSGFYS